MTMIQKLNYLFLSALVQTIIFILSGTIFFRFAPGFIPTQCLSNTEGVLPNAFMILKCCKHFPEFQCFKDTILCLQTAHWEVLFEG